MRRPGILALVALNLLGILLLALRHPLPMLAPGPLTDGHAELATDCFACHRPFRGSPADRCETCHLPADIGVKTTHGQPLDDGAHGVPFHAALVDRDCAACHTAHRAPPQSRRALRPFRHDMLQATVRAQCVRCHAAPGDTLHFARDADCAQCHEDSGWAPAKFDHDRWFKLDRRHDKGCGKCHASGVYREYTCYGCHAHQPRAIRAEHREEGITDIADCASCHPDARESHARRHPREVSRASGAPTDQ